MTYVALTLSFKLRSFFALMAGNLADLITCVKFQDEIFRGYDFTGGRISYFSIDFCMGLTTVQRYCAACDYSHSQNMNFVLQL